MTYTSAQAAKILRKLNDDYSALLENETQSREFLVSLGEDAESVRPAYDYEKVSAEIDEIEGKIRTLKHTLNLFNTTHTVPGFGMTIDEMLVYIPQLTARKTKLSEMKRKLPKQRVTEYGRLAGSVIDYRVINYDLQKVSADYDLVCDELSRAQTALDLVNNSETLELPF